MVWNLECPMELSQTRKYACISMKEIGHNLDGPPKGKKRSYIMFWNFSRLKVAQIGLLVESYLPSLPIQILKRA